MGGEPRLRVASEAVGIDRRARLRRGALRGLALSGALVLLFALAFGFTLHPALFGASVLAGFGGLAAFLSLVVADALRGPRTSPSGVEIDETSLRLIGLASADRTIALADVAQGWWEEPDRVHLALANREVLVVKVKDAAEGGRLLRAAGVTAAERVLRVPLASAISQVPGGSVFGGLLLVLLGSGLFFACVVLATAMKDLMGFVDRSKIFGSSIVVTAMTLLSFATYAVTSALRRREAVVGTDGIAYRRTLKSEFVPYGSLARVAPDTRGVRLECKDGRKVLLPTRRAGERPLPIGASTEAPKTPADAQRRVLLERIREAMASGSSNELPHVALDRLDRNGRSMEAWREELRALVTAEGDYRAAQVSPEDLGGVIEDPAAPAPRRIAAAVALAAREPGEARRRVRIAVQACADEELQRALELAAEGEMNEALIQRAVRRSAAR